MKAFFRKGRKVGNGLSGKANPVEHQTSSTHVNQVESFLHDPLDTKSGKQQKNWISKEREIEIHELDQELIRFSRLNPSCIGVEPKGLVNWSNPEVAREYLTDSRIEFFHRVISRMEQHDVISDDIDILEAASGTGYLLRLMARKFPKARLTGLDTYSALNELAQFLCPQARIQRGDLFDLCDQTYDLVICMETLEHLLDPQGAVESLLHRVNDSGSLFLTVPDGRTDTLPSMGKFPNGKGYWGHIHFWSIESWEVFLNQWKCSYQIDCGEVLEARFLYGLIQTRPLP